MNGPFKQPLCVDTLYKQGHFVADLTDEYADLLLKQVKRETYVEVQPDVEGLDIFGDKYYEGRYIAARSLLKPNDLRPAYQRFANQFNEWAKNVLNFYQAKSHYNLSVFCGLEGYKMDIHTDVGDRAIFDTIIFFGHDFSSHEDGGVLELYKVPIGADEETEAVLVDQIIPTHGKIVVLNNLNPTLFHRVTEVKKKGAKRYQFVANFGMIDPPEWDIEFNDVGGFPLPGEVFKFGETDRLKKLLDEN